MSEASSEDVFISRWFAPLAGPAGLGLRDDAALYAPPAGHDLVLTVDTLVAGVHFFADDPPASIARKALRVNLSDLAAKGAEPAGFLLSFAMPEDRASPVRSEAWMTEFSTALGADARAYDCPLLGGDTVTTPGPLTLSITALGIVPKGAMARRTGARPGDLIFVSGTIGDAALGLNILQNPHGTVIASLAAEDRNFLVQRYREPQPRTALAAALRTYANGSMDVSDGLAGDLAKMMRVSGTSASVDLALVPLSKAARVAVAFDASLMDAMVTGGDDYEIVCTIAPDRAAQFKAAAQRAGVAVTQIGAVDSGAGEAAVFIGRDGRARTFERDSYSHF